MLDEHLMGVFPRCSSARQFFANLGSPCPDVLLDDKKPKRIEFLFIYVPFNVEQDEIKMISAKI